MKRKNLFRGRDKSGKWHEGDYCRNGSQHFILVHYSELAGDYDNIDVIPETISQLLFVINGHIFFEGDIIGRDESNAKYVILWNEENQCFSTFNCYDLKNINEGDELLKLNTLCNMEQVRVGFIRKYNFYPVGNIFDNSEMMEAAN